MSQYRKGAQFAEAVIYRARNNPLVSITLEAFASLKNGGSNINTLYSFLLASDGK